MKAVNYQGAFKVKVEDVPKPALEHPDDVIVKVTTAGESAIVGWHLHRHTTESLWTFGDPTDNNLSEQLSAVLTCTW